MAVTAAAAIAQYRVLEERREKRVEASFDSVSDSARSLLIEALRNPAFRGCAGILRITGPAQHHMPPSAPS